MPANVAADVNRHEEVLHENEVLATNRNIEDPVPRQSNHVTMPLSGIREDNYYVISHVSQDKPVEQIGKASSTF